MRFLADDESFGIAISPTPTMRGFFQFQLIIDSVTIGDAEPCIIGSAMHRLHALKNLPNSGLLSVVNDPKQLVAMLSSSDEMNDATLMVLSESLDEWSIRGFSHRSEAVWVAWQRRAQPPVFLVARVPLVEYVEIVRMADIYWRQAT